MWIDESARVRPAGALLPFVANYAGYRQAGVAPATHRGMPSPFLTLIFTLDEPLTIAAHPDPRQAPGRYDAHAGGLHTTPALITHHGWQSGIQVALSPLGARALLGLPAGELAGVDLEAADLLGPFASEVRERVRAESSWPARFAVLDRMLLTRLGSDEDGWSAGAGSAGAGLADARSVITGSVGAEVGYAWQRLLRSGGTVRVADLAAATGWSDRHLRSRFRAETGLTPKAAARVIRFHRARRRLLRRAAGQEQLILADLAAECGYYDQAHLAREFRALAGCAPTDWLADEFRNIQAIADGQGASS